MVLSASPVSISVPSLFQEAHTNLSIVVGVQRSRFICQYKLCVSLLKLIIVVPSSFAWHLINCSIVKVCIRLSDHSCAWCERQETNHQSHQSCTYELCISCVSCHVCERGGPWDNSPVVATGTWGKEDLPFVCALLNNSKMRWTVPIDESFFHFTVMSQDTVSQICVFQIFLRTHQATSY